MLCLMPSLEKQKAWHFWRKISIVMLGDHWESTRVWAKACFAGSLVVNYPFDDDEQGIAIYSKSPDDAVFQKLALAYSKVKLQQENGYLGWFLGTFWAAGGAGSRLWVSPWCCRRVLQEAPIPWVTPSMLCLQAVREESSVQALSRVVKNAARGLGGESKDIWAGIGCGCCSDTHTSVLGNPECVTKGNAGSSSRVASCFIGKCKDVPGKPL